jgi:hypothetical protein
LKQYHIEIVRLAGLVARREVMKAIGKKPNEDMIACSTTRPGSLWRKLSDDP